MGDAFNMSVRISAFRREQWAAIRAGASGEWNFVWFIDSADELLGDADGQLADNESTQDFVDRLSLAIWRANRGYCRTQVEATELECRPYEVYLPSEDDYRRLFANSPTPSTGATHAPPDRP